MHYLIDGYNFIFRALKHFGDLQAQREAMIHDLNKKIGLVKIEVSIVFDAAFQLGEGSRSHFDRIEILYTSQGESADDYILDAINRHSRPQIETVVTSDKKLAAHVRRGSAHTKSVEEFIAWLDKAYKNKIQHNLSREKKKEAPSPIRKAPLPSQPIEKTSSAKAPVKSCNEDYAQIFEKRWQQILMAEEECRRLAPIKKIRKCPPRHPKKKKDPFAEESF